MFAAQRKGLQFQLKMSGTTVGNGAASIAPHHTLKASFSYLCRCLWSSKLSVQLLNVWAQTLGVQVEWHLCAVLHSCGCWSWTAGAFTVSWQRWTSGRIFMFLHREQQGPPTALMTVTGGGIGPSSCRAVWNVVIKLMIWYVDNWIRLCDQTTSFRRGLFHVFPFEICGPYCPGSTLWWERLCEWVLNCCVLCESGG